MEITYDSDTADSLILKWEPIIKARKYYSNGNEVLIDTLTKENEGDRYQVYVVATEIYRSTLEDFINNHADLFAIHINGLH